METFHPDSDSDFALNKEKKKHYTITAGSKFYLFRTQNGGNLATAQESFTAVVIGKSSWGRGWLELAPLNNVKISSAFFSEVGPREVITWHPKNNNF
jgi:hypothetical protein